MKFSTRTTYGLRAMISLAYNFGQGSVSLTKIAKEEKISFKYLERLFAKLKKAGLVKSEKGMSGGYVLARSPKAITVFDIVRALEGPMALFHCLASNGKIYCRHGCQCGATLVLVKLQKAIGVVLKNMKLSDLLFN